jgi:G3E family GTPase
LVDAVKDLAVQNRFDHLVIESTGISEPMPVAATFGWEFDDGFALSQVARLDTMVTVVDASTFLLELARGDALTERGLAAADEDGRSISDLLVDQVEFADVILLNKTDLVSESACGTVETIVRRLNPTARITRTDHGVVPLEAVLDTGLFDPVLAESAPGWDEEIAEGHTPETEEYGIGSMTFRADRPFHPDRLARVLENVTGVLRSKGFCWIASRPLIAAIWSQAGPNLVIEPAQLWDTAEFSPGQEIVIIGVRLDRALVHDLFESALLTDAEVAAGQREWLTYHDPLPAWGVTHTH